MKTPHPELINTYELAISLQDFLQEHPEAEFFYRQFYGRGIETELHQVVEKRIYNAAVIEEILSTWAERLLPLAAPGGNWN